MRIHNFAAGPCTLPLHVLEEARDEFVDYHGAGASLIEMSHRSLEYEAVHRDALAAARRLAEAPEDFEVLFLQGGASLQFAMTPMNLLEHGDTAGYALTGSWSRKAFADARHHGDVSVAWDGAGVDYSRTPHAEEIDPPAFARYLHICSNETIGGIRWPDWPDVGVPLVIDMSSEYLARPIPWDLVDVVFGGVQKNLGPAGLTIVFVRRSRLDADTDLASYLDWATHAEKDSLHNTPPVFAVWMTGKVLRWLEERGGVPALEAESATKSGRLYEVIDRSDGYFQSPVDPAHRSHMNVVFRLPTTEDDARFLAGATERGLANLKGHRSVGGVRASLYAAMPMAGVEELAEYMESFAR